jgi:hypothetical protein
VTAIIGYCNSFVVTGSETQLLRKTAGSAADVLAATSNIEHQTKKRTNILFSFALTSKL